MSKRNSMASTLNLFVSIMIHYNPVLCLTFMLKILNVCKVENFQKNNKYKTQCISLHIKILFCIFYMNSKPMMTKNRNELTRTTSESEKPSNLPWNLFPSLRTFLTLAGRHVLNLSKYGLGYNK